MIDCGIAAGTRAGEFYVWGPSTLVRCSFGGSRWESESLVPNRRLDQLAWFGGTRYGLGLSGQQVVALHDGTRALELRTLETLDAGEYALTTTQDHTLIGVSQVKAWDASDNYVDRSHIVGLYEVGDQGVTEFPLPEGCEKIVARAVGDGVIVQLEDDDTLTVQRLSDDFRLRTREIIYKPWLGTLLAFPGSLWVQEVGDTTHETVARMAVLDLGTGDDIIDGFLTDEPIWAFARDLGGGRSFLSGQYGRLTVVDHSSERVRSRAFPWSFDSPMRLTRDGVLLHEDNAIDRGVWRLDLDRLELTSVPEHYPWAGHDLPDGGYMTWQDYPFEFDLSPGGSRIAIGGDVLRIACLPDGLRGSLQDPYSELRDFAESLHVGGTVPANADLWVPEIDPPQGLRWVSDDLIVAHGFHGHAVLIDVATQTHRRLDIRKDVVSGLSRHGPCRISTQSGRVWTVDARGVPSVFVQIVGVEHLFELDDVDRFFVARCTDPERTTFLAWGPNGIEEVASVVGAYPLLDSLVVDGRLHLLYPTSIRVYPRLLPED